MLIKYTFRFKEPLVIEDHWPFPVLGGKLSMLSQDGKTIGAEVVFARQPISLAPSFEPNDDEQVTGKISIRDFLSPLVQKHLEQALAFLQCYFDVDILIDEVEAEYVGENEDEQQKIPISKFQMGKAPQSLRLTYDYFTRALMAAESEQVPEFEATLVKAARKAFKEAKYIDSFRYSFLLVEAIFGDGKFKTAQLAGALNKSSAFTSMIKDVLREFKCPPSSARSDTERMLSGSPTVEDVIEHLIQMRGFYFHGNIKRKNAWQPHDQEGAKALSWFALDLAMRIAHAAAAPMFKDQFSQRHFDEAQKVGAIMSLKVQFQFREPGENLDRKAEMKINVPGTTLTSKMALYVAKNFLERFEDNAPVAALKFATCTVEGTGEKVFELKFLSDVVAGSERTN